MRMKPHVIVLGLATVLAVLLGACSGGGDAGKSPTASPYAPTIDPARFTDHVTNRYFPLSPGTTYVYEGTKDGTPQRNEVTVTRDANPLNRRMRGTSRRTPGPNQLPGGSNS